MYNYVLDPVHLDRMIELLLANLKLANEKKYDILQQLLFVVLDSLLDAKKEKGKYNNKEATPCL